MARAKFKQLVDALAADIREGRLPPGLAYRLTGGSSSSATTSSHQSESRNDGDTLRARVVGLVEDDR